MLVFSPNNAPNGVNYGVGKGYTVEEDVWTPYAMAKLDGNLGGARLTGNIGVQGVRTDVTSSGQMSLTIKDGYWMVLPSLNLNLRTASDFVVRFAASKEMMRPRLTDLNNVFSVGVDQTTYPGRPIYNGSGGNPRLLGGYRHEFGSLADAERHPDLTGSDLAEEERDLVLHLIASHHGFARPEITALDPDGPPSANAALAADAALRFARLQRRLGPWGLAGWEALLRAADQRASRLLDNRLDGGDA